LFLYFSVACSYASRRGPSAPTNADTGGESVADNAAPRPGAGGKVTPVVVELFTSEGCSSCPPADAMLTQLDRTQPVVGAEVIVLSQHVDYWNYIGWSDPFSSHDFSERQGEYARAFGKDGVYTPQMVVDGHAEFPGGNRGAALETIAKAAREPKADVQLSRSAAAAAGTDQADKGIRLSVRVDKLPRVSEGDTADVLLALTESGLASSVSRGENAGRRLTHVGVVRRLSVLGSVSDGAFTSDPVVVLDRGWRRENVRAVVFVQERGSKRILGAASYKPVG